EAQARDTGSDSGSRVLRIVGAGLLVGFLTGFLGVGGGFVVVPALIAALGMAMPTAVGTSLVIIALNSAVSLAARTGSNAFDWALILPFTLAAVLGSFGGRAVTDRLPARRLTQIFALLLLAVAAYVLLAPSCRAAPPPTPWIPLGVSGTLAGYRHPLPRTPTAHHDDQENPCFSNASTTRTWPRRATSWAARPAGRPWWWTPAATSRCIWTSPPTTGWPSPPSPRPTSTPISSPVRASSPPRPGPRCTSRAREARTGSTVSRRSAWSTGTRSPSGTSPSPPATRRVTRPSTCPTS